MPIDYKTARPLQPLTNANSNMAKVYGDVSFVRNAAYQDFLTLQQYVSNTYQPSFVVLPVSMGGTNSSAALNNNRVIISSGDAIVEAPEIANNRALASNGNGIPTSSTTTDVELSYLTGTTSQVQPQIDSKVPYTGATGDVDLGEYELKAGQIELDQSPAGVAGVAVTRWNDSIGGTETTLKGGSVILKNGVDLVARVVNKVTPNSTLTKAAYQAVRISGAQGQRLAVALAQANNDNNSADTIGLVTETIATNQEGFIMTVGNLENIDTTGSLQGETWTDGDVLYLSPTVAGAITNTKPIAPQHLVIIGYVEYAHQNNGKIYVKVMNGWELGELHDVDTSGATSGQFLKYNGSIWTPANVSGGTGTVTSVGLTSATSGLTITNSPVTTSGNLNLEIASASGSTNGLLSSTDWTAFNSKQNALGFTPVPDTRTISTTAPLTGGGDLTADRTIAIPAATNAVDGYLSSTNWTTFNNKIAGKVCRTTSDATPITASTANTLVYSRLITGGTFAVGDIVSIIYKARKVGVAGIAILRIYVNTSAAIAGATLIATNSTAAGTLVAQMTREIIIKTATNTEMYPAATSAASDMLNGVVAASALNIDWTTDKYFVFAIQNANIGDTTTASMYDIRLIE